MRIKLLFKAAESQFTNLGNNMRANIHLCHADLIGVHRHMNSRLSAARRLSVGPAASNEVVIARIDNGLPGALIGS
jgi:hypothetical protein